MQALGVDMVGKSEGDMHSLSTYHRTAIRIYSLNTYMVSSFAVILYLWNLPMQKGTPYYNFISDV